MANNRIYLKCRGCGEAFFLGKRVHSGYYIADYPEFKGIPLKDRLNDFYDRHYYCNDFGPDCFSLEYEFEPECGGTNADCIRSMTDEKLANKMSALESFALTCGGGWPPEKWLDWLRQEAEE